jgi:hypothetical protein
MWRDFARSLYQQEKEASKAEEKNAESTEANSE